MAARRPARACSTAGQLSDRQQQHHAQGHRHQERHGRQHRGVGDVHLDRRDTTASPGGGTYTSAQSVTLSTRPRARRSTTRLDNSTPDDDERVYAGPSTSRRPPSSRRSAPGAAWAPAPWSRRRTPRTDGAHREPGRRHIQRRHGRDPARTSGASIITRSTAAPRPPPARPTRARSASRRAPPYGHRHQGRPRRQHDDVRTYTPDGATPSASPGRRDVQTTCRA